MSFFRRRGWVTVAAALLSAGVGGVGCDSGKRGGVWKTADPLVRAMNQGVSLMGQFRYAEAVAHFERATELAPGLAEAQVNLAIARFNRNAKGDFEVAERLLDGVLAKEPKNVRALYFRGILHHHAGRSESAIAFFEKVIGLRPREAAAWYLLGVNKVRLQQSAQEELERAIKENPHLVSGYYYLFQSNRLAKNEKRAEAYLEQFNKLREDPLADKIVLPQYDQMGELALVRPLESRSFPSIAGSSLSTEPASLLYRGSENLLPTSLPPAGAARDEGAAPPALGGAAAGDLDGDGDVDLVITARHQDGRRGLVLLRQEEDRRLKNATAGSGLEAVREPVSCALGDIDNDEKLDLFVACAGKNYLLRGKGDGTFEDTTEESGTGGDATLSPSALFLDADHDGDLDVYVCNAGALDGGEASNQLLNNNMDGTFTDIAPAAGVACRGSRCVMAAPGDIDRDRDTDLIVCREGQGAQVFLNDRLGRYHEGSPGEAEVRADLGGVLQDLNGDGLLDLLTASRGEPAVRLLLGDGRGQFAPSASFDASGKALATWGPVRGVRIGDADLDGDLDIAVFGSGGHLLLNDGQGQFVIRSEVWPQPKEGRVLGAELFDWTGDGVPDLARIRQDDAEESSVELLASALAPPANWMALMPTGKWNRDKGTRSPAIGYGTAVALRAGLHEQRLTYTGLWGGTNQSPLPLVFGLDGASKADYVNFQWPDGVAQAEIGLAAGERHRVAEHQRKISSCPVLFTWDGQRFAFVTDFAGVGGLGYFVARDEYANPQVLEHVKIEPELLKTRDGYYDLRVCEPMEEVAYIDRLELLAIDHPAGVSVFPDERLAVGGPAPTHELLVIDEPIFPVRAVGPGGVECAEALASADRRYAYSPRSDRRFFGFAEPHALELDFGDRLSVVRAHERAYLFVQGYIEYPYSQTVYAAGQAGVAWQPMKIERHSDGGAWETIVPDAGVPGGMGRMAAVDITGKLSNPRCELRITTNLEIHYDQVFVAVDRGPSMVKVRPVPLESAVLRRLGFPREYAPDGRRPLIYDYDLVDATAPFHSPQGAYTRYGSVASLLSAFDDRYAIISPGDEIALRFDARSLAGPGPGWIRSFLLVSHAYCKDMDLYTAASDTVDPLPFRGMSGYPYSPAEDRPDGEEHRRYREQFNTRMLR